MTIFHTHRKADGKVLFLVEGEAFSTIGGQPFFFVFRGMGASRLCGFFYIRRLLILLSAVLFSVGHQHHEDHDHQEKDIIALF